MKLTTYVVLLGVITVLNGCVLTGDSVTSAASKPVIIKITSGTGETNSFRLAPRTSFFQRRQPGARLAGTIEIVEAYNGSGQKIGELRRQDVPNNRGRYGKSLAFVVLDDGVLPVPRGVIGKADKIDKQLLERVLQEERDYGSQNRIRR